MAFRLEVVVGSRAVRVVVAMVAAVGLFVVSPVSAADTGSISGTVTIGGIETGDVGITAERGGESPFVGIARTAANGTYTIGGLPDGDYVVGFCFPGCPGAPLDLVDGMDDCCLSEWYDNSFTLQGASLVSVVGGAAVPNVDANLTNGGSVSGRVGDLNAGLPGQHIELYDLAGETNLPALQTTDESGEYTIERLIPGSYKVRYLEDDMWYSGQPTFGAADIVTVFDDQTTTGIDFDVATTGTISGTVVGEYFGPVPDVAVGLIDRADQVVDTVVTGPAGDFTFLAVPAGVYFLLAVDPLGEFADAWHPDGDMAFFIALELRQDVTGTDIFMQALMPGGFRDIDGSVFEADIVWLAITGITRGCSPPVNDQFCPNDPVTRGQMAAFLVRALGLTEQLDDPFSDDDDSIFEADIEKLAAAGITRGCNPPVNDQFCPNADVTRGQMAAFLRRALT